MRERNQPTIGERDRRGGREGGRMERLSVQAARSVTTAPPPPPPPLLDDMLAEEDAAPSLSLHAGHPLIPRGGSGGGGSSLLQQQQQQQ